MVNLSLPKMEVENMSGEKRVYEERSLYGVISRENQFKVFESQHESAPPVLFKQLILDPLERVVNVMTALCLDGRTKVIFLT